MLAQLDIFDPTTEQKFEAWKMTRGGRHVLRIAYILSAPYARRYQQTGRQVSMKLIWELMRDELDRIRRQFAARGIKLEKCAGFALNNIFTAHVARHILAHRREWAGMFELRETNVPRVKRKVLVIEEPIPTIPDCAPMTSDRALSSARSASDCSPLRAVSPCRTGHARAPFPPPAVSSSSDLHGLADLSSVRRESHPVQ